MGRADRKVCRRRVHGALECATGAGRPPAARDSLRVRAHPQRTSGGSEARRARTASDRVGRGHQQRSRRRRQHRQPGSPAVHGAGRHREHRGALLRRGPRVRCLDRVRDLSGMRRLHRGGRAARHAAQGQIGGDLPRFQGDRNPGTEGIALGACAYRRGVARLRSQQAALRDAVRLRLSLERAAELVATAQHGLALTGAGVSAESGIPTFRGEGGLWTKYDPVKVSSIESFLADPTSYWNVSKDRGRVALAARPNPGHMALAAMEAAGYLVAIVTQNTDGLHQDAGSKRVIELHGSGRMVRCLECGRLEARSAVQTRLEVEMPPRCLTCGSAFLKPPVILFGEPVPAASMRAAREHLVWSRQSPGRDLLTQPVEYIVAWLIQHGRALRRPGQVDPDAAYGAVMRGLDQDPA